ncbi:ATP12 family chaperone protein [Profundibacterium mesophilum]|uniref:ATP12 chaperone protein n=1 Tax=Profundibacterium mesophilum KAUST100406-0324 TaxID=1037889 RepID=A0A921NRF0_9RHOB|nr:ATP12 family protein [Profundibacterium mesophilum]KAF0676187.1 ATP12 chaperone protein [Profundibacterium mesophilum KAUST100406-0324]
MSEWAPKRFWTKAEVAQEEGGFGVRLDGRPVRTPAKSALIVSTEALAEAVAAEWREQGERIDPNTMPMTRTANSAIDKVAPQRRAVAEMLAAYGETDLLCYRAQQPEALAERQQAQWQPLLDWAQERFGARLVLAAGVMPVEQPEGALASLAAPIHTMDAFELAGFHDLVSLPGSLVIGLAAAEGHLPPAELWRLSRLDEIFQVEQWGRDEEAEELAAIKGRAFEDAARFHRLAADRP